MTIREKYELQRWDHSPPLPHAAFRAGYLAAIEDAARTCERAMSGNPTGTMNEAVRALGE